MCQASASLTGHNLDTREHAGDICSDLLTCVIMISTGPQGLVVPRNERICMYNVTLLLELKLLVKYRSHLGRRDISGGFGVLRLGI